MDINIRIYSIILPILCGVLAAFFLFVGLKGILTRKPFLLSNRWLLLLMFIVFIPLILMPFLIGLSEFDLIDMLNPAIFTVVLVMMYFTMKGYAAYGVTDISFREALHSALDKLQLPYEETLSTMKLTSIDADLQVSIQSWVGAGMIKMKQREHRLLLSNIITEMNEHFSLSTGPVKLAVCIFYVIMGVLMAIAGIALVILLHNIGAQI